MTRRGVALAWPALTAAARHGSAAPRGLVAAAGPSLRTDPSPAGHASGLPSSRPSEHPASTSQQLPPSVPQRQRSLASSLLALASPTGHAFAHRAIPAQSRCFSASAASSSGSGSGSESGSGSGSKPGETRMSLGDALNTLVDAAIEKVEQGSLEEAVSLLKEGLNTFEPLFPHSPELGELHNQAALLLLFQNKAEEAAHHAQISLDTTKRHFGSGSVLTAHRLLRLGVARFAQGKMADAAGLLREAYGILDGAAASAGSSGSAPADPGSRAEAGFYLDAVALAHVRDAGGVEALSGSLRENVRGLKEAYGADSMILSLALAQHSRLVHGGLEQADFSVGEALLRQQIAVLSEVSGPESEDVAVARYKLATYYYANDLLKDAGAAVRQAAAALRAIYPDDHDMLVLCKHRLGMICAAQGDHRAASQLLAMSRKHFAAEGGQGMLAKEADIGLAMAKFRSVDPVRETTSRRMQLQHEALELLRKEIDALAEAIGHGHMLVQGATKYYGQLSKMAR